MSHNENLAVPDVDFIAPIINEDGDAETRLAEEAPLPASLVVVRKKSLLRRESSKREAGNASKRRLLGGSFNPYTNHSDSPESEQQYQYQQERKDFLHQSASPNNNIYDHQTTSDSRDDPASPNFARWTFWRTTVRILTFWLPDAFIFGKKDAREKQAFREKIALVLIILFLCGVVTFITVGMSPVLCPANGVDGRSTASAFSGANGDLCKNLPAVTGGAAGSIPVSASGANSTSRNADVYYDWKQVSDMKNIVVFNGLVLAFASVKNSFPEPFRRVLDRRAGLDATLALKKLGPEFEPYVRCFSQNFALGSVDKETPGCFASNLFNIVASMAILSVVLVRLAMALAFNWFLSKKQKPNNTGNDAALSISRKSGPLRTSRFSVYSSGSSNQLNLILNSQRSFPYVIMMVTCYSEGEAGIRATLESLAASDYAPDRKLIIVIADGSVTGAGNEKSTPEIIKDIVELDPAMMSRAQPKGYYAIASGSERINEAIVHVGRVYANSVERVGPSAPVLIIEKCGTEQERNGGSSKPGNRGKRDSQLILMNFFNRVLFDDRMSSLDYDIFCKIQHAMGGNVTAEAFEHLLMVDADTVVNPDALSNMVSAMIQDPSVMGLCGETRIENKYDGFVTAIQVFEYYINHHLGKGFESVFGGVTCLPGCFSMYRLKALKFISTNDVDTGSWTGQRGSNSRAINSSSHWVPILVNNEVLDEYSQCQVQTLHQKNLLLLGEDRFLSTLMLKTFPKRKQIFVPGAKCETHVPNSLSVLLSQRRRWINSTFHNLLELILVRDLCGTFCFSMQFVIMLELVGTVVLPAAICLTLYLIVSTILVGISQFNIIPLILLLIVLGSPALIFVTNMRLQYLGWMAIYLISLPLWNFVMPIYAFWQFDNFSWGTTRKINTNSARSSRATNLGTVDSHSNSNSISNSSDLNNVHGSGRIAHPQIPMKKWIQWRISK